MHSSRKDVYGMKRADEEDPGTLEIPIPFEELPPDRKKRIRRYVYIGSSVFLLLVLSFVVGLNAYTSYKKRQAVDRWQSPGLPVKVIDLLPTDLEEVVEATAVIQPCQEVTVYPEVNAKVLRIEADLGDAVSRDAPLVVLDDELMNLRVRQIRAQIAKLTAICEDAAKNLKRKEKLFRRKTVAESDLDQAVLADQTNRGLLEEAQAQLEMALYDLRHATVRSPIPGNVAERFLEVGSLASPQTAVARIVNIDRVKVEVGLIDDEVKQVRLGQRVLLRVDAFPEEAFEGQVTAVGRQADAQTLTFPVRVEWENTEGRLLPGMIARVSIRVGHHKGVLVVPREIIHDEGGRPSLFTIVDSKARKRTLTLGPGEKENVIVHSGLEAGDKVVVVGHEILDDGVKVQIDSGEGSE
jgi:RND family efflux transporter MFP subunit